MRSQPPVPETFFDHFAQDEGPTVLGSWLARTFSRKLHKSLRMAPGDRVLEIGPGRGDFADACLRANQRYVAIEPNIRMMTLLEQRGATVIRAIVPPLPALEAGFDAVVMIKVLEHLNSMREALELATQVNGILKPGATVMVCCPDFLNLGKHFFNCDFTHNYVTTQRRLRQLLLNAGFGNIRSSYLSGPWGGLPAVGLSAIMARMPFGLLDGFFPDNRIVHKLYKLQLTFSRVIVIRGQKCGE